MLGPEVSRADWAASWEAPSGLLATPAFRNGVLCSQQRVSVLPGFMCNLLVKVRRAGMAGEEVISLVNMTLHGHIQIIQSLINVAKDFNLQIQ
jgi:hypothetical protein